MKRVHDNIIYISCEVLNNKYLEHVKPCDKHAETFLNSLALKSNYEINSLITSEMERYFLGVREYPHLTDQSRNDQQRLDSNYSGIYKKTKPYVFMTVHKRTKLAVLMIVDIALDTDPSMDVDQVSRRNLFLMFDEAGREYARCFSDFQSLLGLKPLDTPKIQVTVSKFEKSDNLLESKDRDYYSSLLLGEARSSDSYTHALVSERGLQALAHNLRQYDFYSMYATSRVILCVLNYDEIKFWDILEDNLDMVFIIELVLLQNAAILNINRIIVDALSKKTKVKYKEISEMYVKYGESMFLREKNVFKYLVVQNLADELTKSFEFDRLFNDYQYNQQHLEHIVQLRASRAAEVESRVINILAIILALLQIVPLIASWDFGITIVENLKNWFYYWAGGIAALFMLALVIINLRRRRKNYK